MPRKREWWSPPDQHGEDPAGAARDEERTSLDRQEVRRRRNRISLRIVAVVAAIGLTLLTYDAGSGAVTAYRALHGAGQPGTLIVEACGPRGCAGTFVPATGGRRMAKVTIDGRYRPGARVQVLRAGRQVWPEGSDAWLWPATVASAGALGLAVVTGLLVRGLVRRRRAGSPEGHRL